MFETCADKLEDKISPNVQLQRNRLYFASRVSSLTKSAECSVKGDSWSHSLLSAVTIDADPEMSNFSDMYLVAKNYDFGQSEVLMQVSARLRELQALYVEDCGRTINEKSVKALGAIFRKYAWLSKPRIGVNPAGDLELTWDSGATGSFALKLVDDQEIHYSMIMGDVFENPVQKWGVTELWNIFSKEPEARHLAY